MRQRAIRILALVWVLAWFGVILPGHQRGVVRLPGLAGEATAETSDSTANRGTQPCPLCVSEPSTGDDDSRSVPVRGGCCALCQFMATLSTPPVFAFDPPDMDLLDLLAAPEVEGLRDEADLDATRSRGPPTVL